MNNGNDWKKRLGMVYSTNPDFQFETEQEEERETLPKQQQKLRVSIEKKTEEVKPRRSSKDLWVAKKI